MVTWHFAWYLLHLAMFPFHVAWYLSYFGISTSDLHGICYIASNVHVEVFWEQMILFYKKNVRFGFLQSDAFVFLNAKN